MLHFDDIVFGPIFSRRLGSSLGVNILPTTGKLCNFDCIYCECGWNKDGKSDGRFPRLAEVEAALEEKMSKAAAEGVPVDSITFSGNGEPTMNPDFPQIVEATVRLRDRYFPEAKVSVLSNAVLVARKEIAEAFNLKFVPLQNRFDELSSDGNTAYWTADGIHPTTEGHHVIKEELLKVIENYV